LEQELRAGAVSFATLRRWALSAAVPRSRAFVELCSLLQERDAAFLAESAVTLARRLAERGDRPELTRELLQFAQTQPSTRAHAEALFQALRGEGAITRRLEYQAPQWLNQLGSPIALGAFGFAGVAARGVSTFVLARAARRSLATLVFSEAAALAVEVPALVIGRRAATQWFAGGVGLLAPSAVAEEMAASFGPFALLRLAGIAPALAGRKLKTLPRFASEVLAVGAGHSLNVFLGWETARGDAWDRWFESVMTVTQMRLAGRFLDAAGIRMPAAWEGQRARLLAEVFSSPGGRPRGPLNIPDLAVGAAARTHAGSDRLPPKSVAYMNGPPEGGGKRGGSGSSNPPPPSSSNPNSAALAGRLLGEKAEEYGLAAEAERTFFGKAAQGLLARLRRKGEGSGPPGKTAPTWSQIDLELTRLERIQAFIRGIANTVSDNLSLSGHENEGKAYVQQEKDRRQVTTKLRRLYLILKRIEELGLNDRRKVRAESLLQRLNTLLETDVWRFPGTQVWREHRRQRGGQQVERHLGALLGFAVLPQEGLQDSALARELRGDWGGAPTWSEDDPDLEFLHRVLAAFSHAKPKEKSFASRVARLAAEHRAGLEASAAMKLYGHALHALAYSGVEAKDLLKHLLKQPPSLELREPLLAVDAVQDIPGNPEELLAIVGSASSAADYLATGLLTLIQSQGNPEILQTWLQAAETSEEKPKGFHPSIPVSLFGAAYGQSALPENILLEAKRREELLERLQKDG
jgi:hypothetical protein